MVPLTIELIALVKAAGVGFVGDVDEERKGVVMFKVNGIIDDTIEVKVKPEVAEAYMSLLGQTARLTIELL